MSSSETDKPYKSIHLTMQQMFVVKFALRDREKELLSCLAFSLASVERSEEALLETQAQLESVRAVLASLETI